MLDCSIHNTKHLLVWVLTKLSDMAEGTQNKLDTYRIIYRVPSSLLFVTGLIISLFLQNFYELQFRHTIRTFLVAIGSAVVLLVINTRLFDFDRQASKVMTLLQVVFISTYGIQLRSISYFFPNETQYTISQQLGFELLLLNIAVISGFGVIAKYRQPNMRKIGEYTKFFCLAFLIIALVSSVPTILSGSGTGYNNTITNELDVQKEKPDIYYIVPDKYTGSTVLSEQFNYSNSNFTGYLRQKGFNVQNGSFANYGASYASLASFLNLNYLQKLGIKEGSSQGDILELLENHKLQELLKRNGYQYHHIGSVYTEFNKHADKSYNYLNSYLGGEVYLNRFEKFMVQRSILYPIAKDNDYYTYASSTPMSFERVSKISQKEEDKFVFLHVMSPHRPYSLPKSVENVTYYPKDNYTERRRYIQELKAVNNLLEESISKILESEDDVIIIVQGDEGPGLIKSENFTRKLNRKQNLRREQSIFFAHYTPKIPKKKFKNKVNPTNIFRIVFNERFNSSFEIISEEKYFNVKGGKNIEFYKKPIKTRDYR
jgi:hypothetical protein